MVGIGEMIGGIGGVLISKVEGALFDHYEALGKIETGYTIMFAFFCFDLPAGLCGDEGIGAEV